MVSFEFLFLLIRDIDERRKRVAAATIGAWCIK